MRLALVSALAVATLVAGGCSERLFYRPAYTTEPVPHPLDIPLGEPLADGDVQGQTYLATEVLVEHSVQPLDPGQPVLVTTLVDVDDLDRSSTFGRMVAEQVAGRLAQLGYYVDEVRLRGALAVKGTGELILSRDLEQLGKSHDAQAVVAGTYAAGKRRVHVSLKLIRLSDGRVLSAMDYALPMGPDTRSLVTAAGG